MKNTTLLTLFSVAAIGAGAFTLNAEATDLTTNTTVAVDTAVKADVADAVVATDAAVNGVVVAADDATKTKVAVDTAVKTGVVDTGAAVVVDADADIEPETPMPAEANTEMTETDAVHLKVVTAAEVQALAADANGVVIIDSRSAEEYAKGHLPGAVLLRADDATPEKLAALAVSKETQLVFYCGSITCPASAKTAYKAHEAGYKNISKYSEGFADWKAKGLAIEGAVDASAAAETAVN